MAKKRVRVDIDNRFEAHPVTGDLVIRKDGQAVRQALLNLIRLQFYEKPFHPEIGSPIAGMLFEPVSTRTAREIDVAIRRLVDVYEPDVEITQLDVVVTDDGYHVSLYFRLIPTNEQVEVKFLLNRAR